jgi:hypothetical protein
MAGSAQLYPKANAQTLSGAIDMHAHSDPDGVNRSTGRSFSH